MALYIGEKNSGDFVPYISFNAKSDKWAIKVGDEKVALKGNFQFVADIANIKTGWFLFQEGMAPNVVFNPDLVTRLPQPSAKHKAGAKLTVYIKGDNPGVYEFSTNSVNVMESLSVLHDDFLAGEKENAGKLPVVEVGDSREIKSSFKNPDGSNGTATNYAPSFKIVKWVPRPAEFDAAPEQNNAPAMPAPAPKAASVSEF